MENFQQLTNLQLKEQFDKNGYAVLQNVFSKKMCKSLTDHMFDLFKQNKLSKDNQCPISDSIRNEPEFNVLVDPLSKVIGKFTQTLLIPTFTYSRIYRPGEELKRHIDRPQCEVSATLTLGYDSSDAWPIFFNENKVTLNVGDLAVYKGCDVEHWRPIFNGNWHVQVFIHYVDLNGPYRDLVKQYYTMKQSKR
jgi:hypothetical protein